MIVPTDRAAGPVRSGSSAVGDGVVTTLAGVMAPTGRGSSSRAARRSAPPRWAAFLAVCGVGLSACTASTSSGEPSPTAGPPAWSSASAPAAPTSAEADGSFAVHAVDLAADAPDEASGLLTLPGTAASGVPGRYLTVDDDDGPLELVAIDEAGAVVGRTRIAEVEAVNPEALALGPCPAGTCVYIGDIGFTQRRTIVVHRLPLDQVVADGTAAEPARATVPVESWRFRWPDDAQDAEGMLIEPDGSVLLVDKPSRKRQAEPTRLYRGPAGGGDLQVLTEFTLPAPTAPLRTLVTGNVVTDAAADDRRVLLLTYDQVIEYTDPAGDARSHLADFPSWPHRNLPLPPSAQAEGIAPTPDGCGYAVVSEAGPSGWDSPVGRLSITSCR